MGLRERMEFSLLLFSLYHEGNESDSDSEKFVVDIGSICSPQALLEFSRCFIYLFYKQQAF